MITQYLELLSLASKQFILKLKNKTYPHFIAPTKNKHQKGFNINFNQPGLMANLYKRKISAIQLFLIFNNFSVSV